MGGREGGGGEGGRERGDTEGGREGERERETGGEERERGGGVMWQEMERDEKVSIDTVVSRADTVRQNNCSIPDSSFKARRICSAKTIVVTTAVLQATQ